MAVFRVEKSRDYTVMSNYHLRDTELSLKAKGLLSQMLSLPEGWDYTLAGLAAINKEGEDAISSAIKELEKAGYVRRQRTQDQDGKFAGIEYVIFELPQSAQPLPENPEVDNPVLEKPVPENPGQLNKDLINKRKKKEKTAVRELTLEEMQPLIVDAVGRLGDDHGWSREQKNQVYSLLMEFYGPRVIKKGGPPVKSERGLNGLVNKLAGDCRGNPSAVCETLEEAIERGWSGIHPAKPPEDPFVDPDEGRRWL